MGFLLKIVEGPNKGAEIALVEGVSVTLGKTDACDIILADPTLPDTPLEISATAAAVLVDGSLLEPFHVCTAGSTAFAVGPADAPWSPLVWPKPEEEVESPKSEVESPDAGRSDDSTTRQSDDATTRQDGEAKTKRANEQTNRRRRRGCLLAALLLLLVLLLLAWLFRARLHHFGERTGVTWHARGTSAVAEIDSPASPSFALEKMAQSYGLSFEEEDGRAKLTGNFATRAERLRATAEAYASRPGIDLDFTDDESFRTAAEDSLFTLTEGAIKVIVATNRYLHLVGTADSPLTLQRTMELLNADLPKLRGFDVSGVKLVSPAASMAPAAGPVATVQRSNDSTVKRPAKPATPTLPVCGILTTPYPCLVMRDGRRISEGGTVGDSVILSIAADEVVITNATGRFTWKP